MKSILLSIKPKWVAKILNGEKTIEVRKSNLKCDLPIDVYIYCTKEDDLGRINDFPNKYFVDCVETPIDFLKMDSAYNGKGKVVAKFRCYKVEEISWQIGVYELEQQWFSDFLDKCCLGFSALKNYLNKKNGYAIHISNLEIFDRPKELNEFYKYTDKKIEWYSGVPKVRVMRSLTKAPQNMCYIETEK